MAARSLVDAALLERLANDGILRALCPDGVYWDLAPAGMRAFVLMALLDGSEVPALQRETGYERTIYLVKAVILTSGGTVTRDAEGRIHELLHQVDLDLSAAGYAALICKRIEPIRYTEVDPAEPSARWQHRGGQYEVMAYPT